MSENMENNEIAGHNNGDQALKDMIGRMQQQLTYLEKKIDILITKLDEKPRAVQPPFKERSPFPGRPYNRDGGNEPPRPFGKGNDKGRDNSHSYKKPFAAGKRPDFGSHGKPFHSKRSGGFHR